MEEIYKNLSLENIEGEIWLPVEGYENYQVSNMGRVKSLNYNHTKQEKILKQVKDKDGYLKVCLFKEGKRKYFRTHRLVAIAFLENQNNYPYVNHKDENPSNNCVDNLEWCDAKYNTNYGTCQRRKVANIDWKSVAEKQSRQVYQYSLDGILVAIWQSVMECGRQGFHQGNVSDCCNGKRKSHKGFKWSYTEL